MESEKMTARIGKRKEGKVTEMQYTGKTHKKKNEKAESGNRRQGRHDKGGIVKKWIALITCLMIALSMGACGEEEKETSEYQVDPQATTLIVEGEKGEATAFTEGELKELGTVTLSYSGRSKSVENARQFFTYEGVELGKVLKAAGIEPEGARMKVYCSDGYTREYDVDELYEMYYFPDNETDDKEKVLPMITIIPADGTEEYPCPFRLIHGQKDYDTAGAMDFNMQGWASYMQYIRVTHD